MRDAADLDVRDAVEHISTLSCFLGVNWSQVQILSARRSKPALTSVGAGFLVWARSPIRRELAKNLPGVGSRMGHAPRRRVVDALSSRGRWVASLLVAPARVGDQRSD